jgi:hypothetical protein
MCRGLREIDSSTARQVAAWLVVSTVSSGVSSHESTSERMEAKASPADSERNG